MKKALKVILIIFLVIIIAIGALAFWQRENIKSIMTGLGETEEEIVKRRDENQEKLVESVNSYLEDSLRELTEEEKKQIEEGKASLSDIYSKIFDEKMKKLEKERLDKQRAIAKDEIVSKYMSQLYAYQSDFVARAESTINQGASYYNNMVKTRDRATSRANTITHFTPIVRSIEAECDAKVEALLANLKKELEAIGAETDIIGTIRETYKNEKQLKLSYYANKYLK